MSLNSFKIIEFYYVHWMHLMYFTLMAVCLLAPDCFQFFYRMFTETGDYKNNNNWNTVFTL